MVGQVRYNPPPPKKTTKKSKKKAKQNKKQTTNKIHKQEESYNFFPTFYKRV